MKVAGNLGLEEERRDGGDPRGEAKREPTVTPSNTTVREPELPPARPPFAVRSDGAILLCIEDPKQLYHGGREVWIGVVLHPWEAAYVYTRVDDAAHDIAAPLIASIRKKPGGGS